MIYVIIEPSGHKVINLTKSKWFTQDMNKESVKLKLGQFNHDLHLFLKIGLWVTERETQMLEIVLSASILSPLPFGLWLDQISKTLQEREGGEAASAATEKSMRKQGQSITQPVYTDLGEALLYPVRIHDGPYICDFRGFFQFIP